MKELIGFALVLCCALASGQSNHLTTAPDTVDSSKQIRASYKANALEAIDLISLAEIEDQAPDILFVPPELRAEEAFFALRRNETTEGERGIRYAVGAYLFAVQTCKIGACDAVSAREDDAIRAVKTAQVEEAAEQTQKSQPASPKVVSRRHK